MKKFGVSGGEVVGFWVDLWGFEWVCGVLGEFVRFWVGLWGFGWACGALGEFVGF